MARHPLYEPPDNPTPEDILIAKQDTAEIDKVMQLRLSPREEFAVRKLYGLGAYSSSTLEQVAQVMGVTRERVRQIVLKSCRKLKHVLKDQNRYRWHLARHRARFEAAEQRFRVMQREKKEAEWRAQYQIEMTKWRKARELEDIATLRAVEAQMLVEALAQQARARLVLGLSEQAVAQYAEALNEMLAQRRGIYDRSPQV